MAKTTKPRVLAAPVSDNISLSIRKIENGYITRESGTKRGKWYECERYSEQKPTIEIPKGKSK